MCTLRLMDNDYENINAIFWYTTRSVMVNKPMRVIKFEKISSAEHWHDVTNGRCAAAVYTVQAASSLPPESNFLLLSMSR